jgi:hypothetical protein
MPTIRGMMAEPIASAQQHGVAVEGATDRRVAMHR